MAAKKKPYAVYETKEDFEKWFKVAQSTGYERGYKDGLARALGYILNCMEDDFDSDVRKEAERESKQIGKIKFERRLAIQRDIKKQAVEAYIREQEAKPKESEQKD